MAISGRVSGNPGNLSSFNEGVGFSLDAFHTPTTWLRLLHYHSRSWAFQEGIYGSAPHLDFGCLTLLAQDEVGGLQVLSQEEEWVDVPFIAGSIVLNVGEMLQRLSNGFLIPTPHRMINPENRERYSCPFFYDPPFGHSDQTLERNRKPQIQTDPVFRVSGK